MSRRELFGADTDEPNRMELAFQQYNDFIKVIASNDYRPITDDVERTLSLRRLHDKIYNLEDYDRVHEKTFPATDVFEPMNMKAAYVMNGKGSARYQMYQEFVMREVHKNTGLNLKEWMDLTPVDQNIIKEIIDEKRNIETRETERLTNSLSKD